MNAPSDNNIEIACYGMLQQVCGGHARRVNVPSWPVSVRDVLAVLAAEIPDLQRYLPHTACAVGDRIVDRDAELDRGDVLVLLPPVSGG